MNTLKIPYTAVMTYQTEAEARSVSASLSHDMGYISCHNKTNPDVVNSTWKVIFQDRNLSRLLSALRLVSRTPKSVDVFDPDRQNYANPHGSLVHLTTY